MIAFKAEGKHCFANLKNCNAVIFEKELQTKIILEKVAELSNANPLKFVYQSFKPHGATAALILSESHITIHTYYDGNEQGLGDVFADVFTCGTETTPEEGLQYLISTLKPTEHSITSIERKA